MKLRLYFHIFIFLQCIKYYNKNLLKLKEELENFKNEKQEIKFIKEKKSWFLDTKIE